MENAVHAIIMAFSVIIFVIGLTVAVFMFSKVATTAETLLYYAEDKTYYDNIKLESNQVNRTVDLDTIIPTLYRYYKENFCVKIYSANGGELKQIFDVNLEGEVRTAAAATSPTAKQKALNMLYNDKTVKSYLFEAPWIGSTDENIKSRVDYYINGKSGYINNSYINYEDNYFYKCREYNRTVTEDKIYFKENFINYAYTGETITNDDGEILIEGSQPKDKIVVVYTATKNP